MVMVSCEETNLRRYLSEAGEYRAYVYETDFGYEFEVEEKDSGNVVVHSLIGFLTEENAVEHLVKWIPREDIEV